MAERRTDEHATLANQCLVEIEGLADVLIAHVELHVGTGAVGAAFKGVLLRVKRLSELACICWDEDPEANWDMSLEALRAEINGAPTRPS